MLADFNIQPHSGAAFGWLGAGMDRVSWGKKLGDRGRAKEQLCNHGPVSLSFLPNTLSHFPVSVVDHSILVMVLSIGSLDPNFVGPRTLSQPGIGSVDQ